MADPVSASEEGPKYCIPYIFGSRTRTWTEGETCGKVAVDLGLDGACLDCSSSNMVIRGREHPSNGMNVDKLESSGEDFLAR